jgi:hypothetical protein
MAPPRRTRCDPGAVLAGALALMHSVASSRPAHLRKVFGKDRRSPKHRGEARWVGQPTLWLMRCGPGRPGRGATWLELLQALVPAPRRARRHPAKRHEILHHSSWRHPDVFRDGAIGGVRAQPVKRRQNARLHFEVTLTPRLTSVWAAGPLCTPDDSCVGINSECEG